MMMLVLSTVWLAAAAGPGQAELTIDLTQPATPVSPSLYGIFFEDINHAADGGLYAQLVCNWSFEDMVTPARCTVKNKILQNPGGWKTKFDDSDPIPGWKKIHEGKASVKLSLEDKGLFNTANAKALRMNLTSDGSTRAGVVNEGFWGMALKEGANYLFSMYVKADADFKGPLAVSLEGNTGAVYAQQEISTVGADWKKEMFTLTSSETDAQAHLVISAKTSGTVWLDMVSLFPEDTYNKHPNGTRADLTEMLAGLKPAFIRFPGGCFVEGFTVETAFRWKKTIGPMEERPGHWNLWGYRTSNGLGYHELLQLCEDLGAAPMVVVNCGMTCQGRAPEFVPLDQLDEWVQDALDAIEYANGPETSRWGAERAKNGHPKPFGLKYLEIGNENSGPEYDVRYKRFYEAVKQKYPEIQCIANVPVKNVPVDIVDEHYYNTPDFFLSEAHHYDGYDRKGPEIYVGEYAVVQQCGQGNLRAAVAEAAFLTGLERNADIVTMSSYAPLFVNVNDRTWNPDAIVFDSARCYGTASYQVQKLFAEYRADESLASELRCESIAPVTGGGIGLGTWQTQAEFKDVNVMRGDEILFAPEFAKGAEKWKVVRGDWSIKDGVYQQRSEDRDLRSVAGDPNWTDYTVTLKARKVSGREGFLILFNVKDENNWIWWNLGGWGNRWHGLEMCRSGVKSVVGDRPEGTIETGRWYDLRIETQGDHIRCFLDNTQIHDVTLPGVVSMAAVAGRKTADKSLVVKLVNASDKAQETTIRFKGPIALAPDGEEIILTSASPDDENTLDAPLRVAPVQRALQGIQPEFKHVCPPNSVSVLLLKTR